MRELHTHSSLSHLLLDRGVKYNYSIQQVTFDKAETARVSESVNNKLFSDGLISVKFNIPVM